jgi:SAM-dependent methyltransferase
MPDLKWNQDRWDVRYEWPESGDEWSAAWGGPRPHWYGAILPRIARWLPARRILEIAPGFGRWTQFLLRQSERYYGVDLSPKCVQRCRQRFAAFDRAHFIQNDGRSLQMIPDQSIDFVFSFDSLVHAELDVLGPYCEQLVRKLSADGVAFIHHSNALAGFDPGTTAEGRARTVSSRVVKEVVEKGGGRVLVQEEMNWASTARIDCMTTFCRDSAYPHVNYQLIENSNFMAEAEAIRASIGQYP